MSEVSEDVRDSVGAKMTITRQKNKTAGRTQSGGAEAGREGRSRARLSFINCKSLARCSGWVCSTLLETCELKTVYSTTAQGPSQGHNNVK